MPLVNMHFPSERVKDDHRTVMGEQRLQHKVRKSVINRRHFDLSELLCHFGQIKCIDLHRNGS